MALCRKMEGIEVEAASAEATEEVRYKLADHVSSKTARKMKENERKAVQRRSERGGGSAMETEARMIYSAFCSVSEDLDLLCALLEEMEQFYRENKRLTTVRNASRPKWMVQQIKELLNVVSRFRSEELQMLIPQLEAELDHSRESEKEEKAEQDLNSVSEQLELRGQMQEMESFFRNIKWPTIASSRFNPAFESIFKQIRVLRDETSKAEMAEQGMDGGNCSSTEAKAVTESIDEQIAASHRSGWEYSRGSKFERCGGFEDMTSLSPMYYSHCTPGLITSDAVVARTLQIYSIKISELKGPIEVYGLVAARDTVDHNRNLLFRRRRGDCQILTPHDPFLRLTGPSRAILSMDPVTFEILLKVKGRTKSEDQVLITEISHYNGLYSGRLCSSVFNKPLGKITLSFEQLEKTVQATILGICVVQGEWSWPFKYGGRVVCSSSPQEVMEIHQGTIFVTEPPDRQVVLLDYRGGTIPMGLNGYLDLPRQVVSAELRGRLKVLVQTYSASGEIAAEGRVYFTPEECNISRGMCDLGDFKVEITIAWSLLIGCKDSILVEGYLL